MVQKVLTMPQEQRAPGICFASSFIQHYTYGLPDTISRKYACSDDLTIMHSANLLEDTLSKELATISNYLKK